LFWLRLAVNCFPDSRRICSSSERRVTMTASAVPPEWKPRPRVPEKPGTVSRSGRTDSQWLGGERLTHLCALSILSDYRMLGATAGGGPTHPTKVLRASPCCENCRAGMSRYASAPPPGSTGFRRPLRSLPGLLLYTRHSYRVNSALRFHSSTCLRHHRGLVLLQHCRRLATAD
jgi:hypothetical protein